MQGNRLLLDNYLFSFHNDEGFHLASTAVLVEVILLDLFNQGQLGPFSAAKHFRKDHKDE